MQKPLDTPPPPLLLNMRQTSLVLNFGKSKIYELMENEGLSYTKLGKSLRFPYRSLQEWIEKRMQGDAA